ncbi:MAG TPA: hypothetical protein VGD43_23175 [Micromonospora sp.]
MTASGTVDTGDIESSRLALTDAFDALRKGVDTCVDGFNHIVDKANDHAWLLGPIPMYLIHNHLDDIRTALKSLLDAAERVLQGGMPILSLFQTSIDYLTAVQSPMSDISYDINTPADDNLNYWTGGAATAYAKKQIAQRVAVDRTVDNAAFMSRWLFDIGKTNVAYAVELVKIVVDAGSELVKVSVDGLSIINLPFALDSLAEALKKLIKAGLDQLVELANKFVATLGDVRDVLEKTTRHTEYEDGRWPQAVYN